MGELQLPTFTFAQNYKFIVIFSKTFGKIAHTQNQGNTRKTI